MPPRILTPHLSTWIKGVKSILSTKINANITTIAIHDILHTDTKNDFILLSNTKIRKYKFKLLIMCMLTKDLIYIVFSKAYIF